MSGVKNKQYRIDHGLCPNCGEEAAPYYLCQQCRMLGTMRRMLNKMADRGVIKKALISGKANYSVPPDWEAKADTSDFHWGKTAFDMAPGDARLRPKLGRRPVDVDETLFSIFLEAGKPLHMNEILHAWGKLRSKRKHGVLANDMRIIIEAQRRRDAKNARRARMHRGFHA